MADFANTLVVAVVVTIISVLAFLALILVIALYWTSIVRRLAPNRFKEPEVEKAWPSSGSETGSSTQPSPVPSPRASALPKGAPFPKAVLRG